MCEVTIIIPVNDYAININNTIESCLNQTFENVEIIIIYDASLENTLQIANEYEYKNKCIRFIKTESKGLSEVKNAGIKLARGRYVYFLYADSFIKPQTVGHCYKQAIENKLDMVLFDSKVQDSKDTLISEKSYYMGEHIANTEKIYTGKEFIETFADKKDLVTEAYHIFVRREFLLNNDIWFLPEACYEDVAFYFSCIMQAERIMYIPEAYSVRLYKESSEVSSYLDFGKISSVYKIIKEMFALLVSRNMHKDYAWLDYLSKQIRNLHRNVLGNISGKYKEQLELHSKEILKLQHECIVIYYKLLTLMGEKVSNIRKTLEFIEEIITPFRWVSKEIIDTANEIVTEREKIIFRIFNGLPLNKENKRIGIYGSGKHAEYILKKYKEMFGDIKADIVFIDTYKQSFSEKRYNYDIVNVSDLDTIDISDIVILSYFYEEDMYNNIITRYGNKYKIHRIYNGDNEPIDSLLYRDIYNNLVNLYKYGKKRIILINTPIHTNIGDHIIAYAAMKFFEEFLPEYDVIEVTDTMYKEFRNDIFYRINVDDIIVITGGGFLGSLWPYSGQNVYDIIKDFPDNKIVILPQSLYFEDTEEGQGLKKQAYELFINHKDLYVCYRESISYDRSENIFKGKIKSYLMPDMALTLNYSQDQMTRRGILLCLRKDKEGLLTEKDKSDIKNHFLKLGETVEESSMHWHSDIEQNQREEVINGKINEIKKYKLVVTDALHCMIACAISGTPCIAVNNIYRKLEGIYKSWLNDLKYVRFVDSFEDIFCMDLDDWDELYKNNYYDKDFSSYMKQLAELVKN